MPPVYLPVTGTEVFVFDNIRKDDAMSATEKAKAKVQQLSGSIKEETGRTAQNDQTAAEGADDNMKGNLREAKERLKDAFRD
ncbi:CsbD-like protein (plasmid) [Streptomyces rimosus subsp. rimosus]|nr:CsbD family protein [Streptomyces rimosus]UNZ08842.1 CsbD-like protein [Streptomyces rimosus subsp. rimosus]